MTLSFNRFYARCHLLGSTVLVGAMAAAIMPIGAVAQDATTLEPIILRGSGAQTISEDNDTIVPERSVSALKTDTPLAETPRSVSVITRKEMEQRAVTDIIQATRYSSGVSTGGFGYDPRFDQIYIRGIETTVSGDFRDGLRQPVMTYGTFTTEIYTLDRVEVLKGPVSVMYGAASAAGIVNKISKLPLQEAHHEVELQYGTVGRKQAAFDFGGPIGQSNDAFYRVVGLVREGRPTTIFRTTVTCCSRLLPGSRPTAPKSPSTAWPRIPKPQRAPGLSKTTARSISSATRITIIRKFGSISWATNSNMTLATA